jgi:predicted lipoprotein with Yx(FWY)xxD motif
VIALAATLAACGGGNGEGTASAMQNTGTGAQGKDVVSVQEIGEAGSVLVDSSGQALYASDLEANGKVLCTEACNSFWQPLTAEGKPTAGDSSLVGKLGMIERPDGTQQVSYAGMPLYTFTQEGPEEVTGDGFVDAFNGNEFTWSVVKVGGSSGSGADAESSGSGGRSYSY